MTPKDSKKQPDPEEEPEIPEEVDLSEWEIIEEGYKKKPD